MIRKFPIALLFVTLLLAFLPAASQGVTFASIGLETATDHAPDLQTAMDDFDHNEKSGFQLSRLQSFAIIKNESAPRASTARMMWRPPMLTA